MTAREWKFGVEEKYSSLSDYSCSCMACFCQYPYPGFHVNLASPTCPRLKARLV